MNVNIYNPYVRHELELYHHGVAGQKWGKRNGPPYPLSAGAHSVSENKAGWRKSLAGTQTRGGARKYTKELNKNDKKLATARYDKVQELEKAAKYQKKADKIAYRGGSDKKIAKLQSKAKDHMQKAAIHEKKIKQAQKRTNELVKYLSAQGYSMNSRKTQRMVHVGRSIAQSTFRNSLRYMALAAVGSPITYNTFTVNSISGTKYKVKKTKNGNKQFVQSRNDNDAYEYSVRNQSMITSVESRRRNQQQR